MSTTRHLVRCTAVWATVAGLTVGGTAWLLPTVPRHPTGAAFPDLVVGVASLALVGCLWWAWLVTTSVVLEQVVGARRGRAPGCGRSLARTWRGVTPSWARHLVVLACGMALVAPGAAHASSAGRTLAPAPTTGVVATAPAGREARHARELTERLERAWRRAHDEPAGPLPLGGLPLPDRADAPHPRRRALDAPVGEVVVRPGDDLWSIAADLLGPRADAARIARATAALYAANRAAIGADPDLVVPGQHLRLPFPSADRREELP